MIITGGLSIQMVVVALLTVKSVLDRVWFPDYHVDESSFCLAPSLPLKLILRCLVPEFTPPTPLNWPDMCEALSFLGSRGPVTHGEQSPFLWLYTCCWQWSGHELGPRMDMATTICHGKRWNRIGRVCRIKIIRESGEWSSAKRKKRMSNGTEDGGKHSMVWMCMTATMEFAGFMGMNYLNNCQSIGWKSIFYQSSVWATKPLSMPRTMPFGVPQQDRTTLFLFTISGGLHVWTWPWFGWHSSYQSSGSPSGCSMLIHSPQRSWKSQWGTRAQLHSSLCSFSNLGTGVSFSFHDLSHGECILHFLPIGPWRHTWRSSSKQKSMKFPRVCLWTSCAHKTLLVLLPCCESLRTDQSSSCFWRLRADFLKKVTQKIASKLKHFGGFTLWVGRRPTFEDRNEPFTVGHFLSQSQELQARAQSTFETSELPRYVLLRFLIAGPYTELEGYF